MSATRLTTAKLIKPLGGAIIRRYTSGAAIAAGECVYMASTGYISPCNTTSAAMEAIGIAVQAAVGAAERVDVVVHGPVLCMSGATIGATVFNTTTAGEFSETSGGSNTALGWAETAAILFVQPEHLA